MTFIQPEKLNFCVSYAVNVYGIQPVVINSFFADVQVEIQEFICLAGVYLKLHRLQQTEKSHIESFTEAFTSPHVDHFEINDSVSFDIIDYTALNKDEIAAAKLLNTSLGQDDFFSQENILGFLFHDMQKMWSVDAESLKNVVSGIKNYDNGILGYFVSCLEANKSPDYKNILTAINYVNFIT